GPVLSQAAQSRLVLVHGGDVPTLRGEPLCDRRAHPAAADNDELHRLTIARPSTLLGGTIALQYPLRERDNQDFARGLFEDVGAPGAATTGTWRGRRAAEPSTIRSVSRSAASWTIACPIDRARTILPSTLTPWSAPRSFPSASGAAARHSSSRDSAS